MSNGRPQGRPLLFAEVAGIEPTGRGSPVPLVLKTRGPTRRPFTSGSCVSRLEFAGHSAPPAGGSSMKKLMILVIVLALGAVVAKKKMAA
jgi:hypothetical protein